MEEIEPVDSGEKEDQDMADYNIGFAAGLAGEEFNSNQTSAWREGCPGPGACEGEESKPGGRGTRVLSVEPQGAAPAPARWPSDRANGERTVDRSFVGIAEFERDLIRERTGAGRTDAQERDVRFGRLKQ